MVNFNQIFGETSISSLFSGLTVVVVTTTIFWTVINVYSNDVIYQLIKEPNIGVSFQSVNVTTDDINHVQWVIEKECPQHIITIHFKGNLGNQMCQYATLYSFAKLFDYYPVMAPATKAPSYTPIEEIYKDLSVPYWDAKMFAQCKAGRRKVKAKSTEYGETLARLGQLRSNKPAWIELQGYAVAVGLFKDFLSELRREFRLDPKYRRAAVEFLEANSAGSPDPVYVAVHVRRGDYVDILTENGGKIAGREFFAAALEQVKRKLPPNHRGRSLIAVVVGNDIDWNERHLADLPLVDKTVSARNASQYLGNRLSENDLKLVDLELMWSCHHAIFAYGSFGLWGALFAGAAEEKVIVTGVDYHPKEKSLPGPSGIKAANLTNMIYLSISTLELREFD